MASETKIGSYTGTGAAINVELGWVPDHIEIINITDGDEKWTWFESMSDANAIHEQSIADDGTTSNVSMEKITSNGVTPYEPTNLSNKKGFTVGTAISEDGKTFAYKATRNAPY